MYGIIKLVNRKPGEIPLMEDAIKEADILGLKTATRIQCLREEQLRLRIQRLEPPSTPPRFPEPLFFDSPVPTNSRSPLATSNHSSPRKSISSFWTLNKTDSVEVRVRQEFADEIKELELLGSQACQPDNMLHSKNWDRLR